MIFTISCTFGATLARLPRYDALLCPTVTPESRLTCDSSAAPQSIHRQLYRSLVRPRAIGNTLGDPAFSFAQRWESAAASQIAILVVDNSEDLTFTHTHTTLESTQHPPKERRALSSLPGKKSETRTTRHQLL